MAYSGVLEDIKKSVSLQVPNRLPVFACSEEFDVHNAGVLYNDYNRDAKLMAKVQIESIKKYDYDWAWLQVDDCIEFEVLGVGVKGEGDILPATCDYLPATQSTLRGLKMPNPKTDGRMPVLLEAIKRIKDELGDTVCVTGRVAAPFSSTTLLYGMTESMLMLYDDPDLIKETIKFFTELQINFAMEQLKAGADALWVGDCNASGHLISVDQYKEFAAESAGQLATAIRENGGFSYYHASEHSIPHLVAQAEIGMSAVSVGPGLDLAVAKENAGSKVCLLGNVDPINFLLQSDAESVYNETKRVGANGIKGGGYLFNSGEMIPRDVPEENMKAMIRAAREIQPGK